MKNSFKNIISILSFSFLFSCENRVTKESSATTYNDSVLDNPYHISKNSNSNSSSYNSCDNIPIKQPKEINFDIFSKRNLTLSNPFDPIDALHKIYQGDTVKDDEGKNYPVIEIWKCNKCKLKKFESTIIEDTITFPFEVGNDTRILSVFDFQDSSKNNYKILTTTTSEFSEMHVRVGRYIPGILGLSIFQNINNKWNLISFNPALGCYGMFQTVNTSEIITGKNSFLITINNIVGGPAEPYWGNLTLIGLYNNEFKILLEESGTYRLGNFSGNSNWNTRVLIEKENPNSPPATIQLIISGDFNYDKYITNDILSNLPKALKEVTKKDEDYLFKIKKYYILKKGKYILTNEVSSIKKK